MFSNFLESLYDGIGDDEADDDDDENIPKTPTERHVPERNADRLPPMSPEEEAQARGVKDDLSELSHTLTRKFRGVANFLAPLPERSSSDLSNPRLSQSRFSDPELNQSSSSDPRLNRSSSSDPRLDQSSSFDPWLNQPPSSSDRPESCVGIDTRETEIRARSSDTMEDKRLEDLRDDLEEEEEEETDEEEEEEEEEEMDAVALTDEVLAFARNIAMHPETWLDFPLDPDEDLDGITYTLLNFGLEKRFLVFLAFSLHGLTYMCIVNIKYGVVSSSCRFGNVCCTKRPCFSYRASCSEVSCIKN